MNYRQKNRFEGGEADNWFFRNQEALRKKTGTDVVSAAALSVAKKNTCLLDVGCSDGWRADFLRNATGCEAFGVDPSGAAVASGQSRFPELRLQRGLVTALPFEPSSFDLLIVSYVLHWVDRPLLNLAISEVERVLAPGGYLVLADFLPDAPIKKIYHHVKDEEIFTFKQDYSESFLAAEKFERVGRVVYNHDSGIVGDCSPDQRGFCDIMKKR